MVVHRDGDGAPEALQGRDDATPNLSVVPDRGRTDVRFYEEIIEDTDALICRFARDGTLTYANAAYRAYFGLTREQLTDFNVFTVIPPEDRELVRHHVETLTRPRPTITYEHRVMNKAGQLRWQQGTDRALFDTAGRLVEYQSVGFDTTSQHETTAQLQATLKELTAIAESAVHGLAHSLAIREPYTAEHQEKTADITMAIAAELGFNPSECRRLYYGALLHDIGKNCVPSEILCKPGALSEAEFGLMCCHAEYGADILQRIRFPWPIWRIAASHHERLDGSGYPLGLRGEDIDMEVRIVSVADVLAAMTSHRPYRAAHTPENAIAELHDGSNTRYDARVVAACDRLWRVGRLPLDTRSPGLWSQRNHVEA